MTREGTGHLSKGNCLIFLDLIFRFFASERLGRKIMKLDNEELFPHLHKIKDLEVQRCSVPFR